MESRQGGRLLGERLDGLRAALREYFGAINEVKEGLHVEPERLVKPDALVAFETCQNLGIPIVGGGLLDQPHIWLMEYIICQQETELFAALARRNEVTANATSN